MPKMDAGSNVAGFIHGLVQPHGIVTPAPLPIVQEDTLQMPERKAQAQVNAQLFSRCPPDTGCAEGRGFQPSRRLWC